MSDDLSNLPDDLKAQFLGFLRETDGRFEVSDFEGLVKFIALHHSKYPALLDLISINESAVVDHFERTGEVPPGIKLVRTTRESENVTRLEVRHGPTPPKSK